MPGKIFVPDSQKRIILLVGLCLIFLALVACSAQATTDPSLSQTQVAMQVQMTVMAQQMEDSVQATVQAQNATAAFTSAQATLNAQAPEPTAVPRLIMRPPRL